MTRDTEVMTSGWHIGLTVDERNFLNSWCMFGTHNAVSKIGKKWTVSDGRFGFGLFTTKREAMERASDFACALGRRNREAREAAERG